MFKIGRMSLMHLLLSSLLLLCFSMQGNAQDSGGDYVIAQPSVSGANMDMPAPKVSAPNMDMPSPTPKPLGKQNSKSNQTLTNTSSASSSNASSNQTKTTQVIQIEQETKPLNVTGKWSIKLGEGTDGSLDLNLWSSAGTRIMGYGTLSETGAINYVTASGSVGEKDLKLIVKSATSNYANLKNKECDLDLFMTNDTLSGTYVMTSGGQYLSRGNAKAVRQ
jgi:hypothetical protein